MNYEAKTEETLFTLEMEADLRQIVLDRAPVVYRRRADYLTRWPRPSMTLVAYGLSEPRLVALNPSGVARASRLVLCDAAANGTLVD